ASQAERRRFEPGHPLSETDQSRAGLTLNTRASLRSAPWRKRSAPGLDQLQHLGTDTSGTALTIEGLKDQSSGGFQITRCRCRCGGRFMG
ncbi:MAG: hypothetical protein ACO3FA_08730, partial [Vulcanococcus sp.]